MKRALIISLAASVFGFGAQIAAQQSKPRVYVTDSTSWEMSGGWGESGGTGGGAMKGGARPQTAEIIKTFGQRCPDVIVNNKRELADFVVLLDHEGGKGLAQRKNKIAVFARSGDSIFSASTRSLGNSVKDACAAILTDFEHNPPKDSPASANGSKSSSSTVVTPLAQAHDPRTASAASVGANSPISLTVKSTPDGADITIDGKFVGSTPSTLKLPPGEHTVVVGAAGFKTWQRTMTLTSGSDITLNAILDKT